MFKRFTLLAAAFAGMSCSDMVEVEPPVELTLEMSDRVVAPGEPVSFAATAFNPTSRTVGIGMCGYSLDVVVVGPDGEHTSVYYSMLAGAIPTCDARWYHQVRPGEHVTLPFDWVAADNPGVYGAYAKARCHDEPCLRGASMSFKVE